MERNISTVENGLPHTQLRKLNTKIIIIWLTIHQLKVILSNRHCYFFACTIVIATIFFIHACLNDDDTRLPAKHKRF